MMSNDHGMASWSSKEEAMDTGTGADVMPAGGVMEIIDFFASDKQEHWLSEIQKSDWSAGRYLYELLRDQKLKELCGESTKALLADA